MKVKALLLLVRIDISQVSSCKRNDRRDPGGIDPDAALKASADRFNEDTGTSFVRDGSKGLPAVRMPGDFDQAPPIAPILSTDDSYASLWEVDLYDSAVFAIVGDRKGTPEVGLPAESTAIVNCPGVEKNRMYSLNILCLGISCKSPGILMLKVR